MWQMYVALFPCNECAKLIIQSGIREVVFMSDKYHDTSVPPAWRLVLVPPLLWLLCAHALV